MKFSPNIDPATRKRIRAEVHTLSKVMELLKKPTPPKPPKP